MPLNQLNNMTTTTSKPLKNLRVQNTKAYSITPAAISLMELILNKIKYTQNRNLQIGISDVCELTSMSASSIRNGINMLYQLGIIESKSKLVIIQKILDQLNENPDVMRVLFDHIIIFEPFIEYIYFKQELNSDEKASKHLRIMLNLKGSPNVIKSTFNGWIKKLKIRIGKPELEESLMTSKDINGESQAIFAIRNIFDKNLKTIPDLVLNDLKEALMQFETYPSNSLTDSGRALENYLRIKFSSLIDLSKCNGVSQIAEKLRQLKILNNKHINIIKGIGSIRTMGDSHGLDKKDGKIWIISDKSALISCLLVIKTISSIDSYLTGNLSF